MTRALPLLRHSLSVLRRRARRHRSVPLDGVVRAETPYGELLVPAEDPYVTRYLLRDGVWEAGETALYEEELEPGMTFVDVGAHIGYFTLLASRLVGRSGRVSAFEPHPRSHRLLIENVRLNRLHNVTCFQAAVGASSGDTMLYVAAENTGDHRVYPAEEERATLRVPALALDDLDSLAPPVDVVKIDIQGSEEAAVRGMERLLRRSPRALITVEFWPYGIRSSGGDPRSVLEYYRSLGYFIQVQIPETPGLTEWSDDEILDYCRGKDGWEFTTLVLTRR